MFRSEKAHSEYFTVWVWLVVLLAAGVALVALPIPKTAAAFLVFGVAAIKAVMVVRNYMHLKSEHLLIIAIAVVPLLFFIGLLVALIPDIAMRP